MSQEQEWFMAYADFSIDRVALDFDLKIRKGSVLDHVGALAPPPWLPDALLRGRTWHL